MGKKRRKKSSLRQALRRINFLPVMRAVVVLLVGAGLVFMAGYIWRIVCSSGCFKVCDVIVRGDEKIDFSYLKGEEIFKLNLKKECGRVLNSYPDCRRISFTRVLPNRIFVDFIKRDPLAWVKLSKNFAVDEDGVLFLLPEEEKGRLPLILGLEKKITDPKAGARYTVEELRLAMRIIKEFNKNEFLSPYRLRKINAENVLKVKIFIGLVLEERGFEDLEVRISEDNLRERIKILAGFLEHSQKDLADIEYVDLRFRDPVVKLKDAK